MLPMPAPMPAATRMRRSSLDSLIFVAMNEAEPGADLQRSTFATTGSPDPRVIADATIFTSGTRGRMTPPCRW